jgi:hypothetical protein
MGFLDRDDSDRSGSVSKDAYGERFGRDLLLIASGRFDGGEELGFCLEGAIIFDQD